ncbi:flagellar hook-length control protein FliK [Enterobacteriaceae bacterium RIT691]|nr:flagellar hook-length control protein FliK [Enterobacteriaceae bacterium RIT691]
MNSVQPAVQALLATQQQQPTQGQPQRADGEAFTLDDAASGVVSRHLAHPAKAEKQKDEHTAQDLTALMAMLLAPTAAPNETRAPAAASDILRTSRLAGADAHTLVKALGMLSAKQEKGDGEASQPLLPQALQALLNKTSGKAPEGNVTQQATLAKFSAQDLHSLGASKPTVAKENILNRPHTDLHANLHAAMKNQVADRTEAVSNPVNGASLTAVSAMSDLSPRTITGTVAAAPAHAVPAESTNLDELGEKLNMLLKDRIQFQLDNQQQVSTIRLDPPSMGKLEIAVHLDGNQNLTVHIGASQSDVLKTLQQFSDQLRQHLVQHNFMQVNVQVSPDGQSHQHQHQQQQRENEESTILASARIEDTDEGRQNESVLLKV